MLLTVLVADPQRLAHLRDGLPLPGRVLRYSSSNLASVFESIRANQPGLIVLDSVFLNTLAGQGFVDRLVQLSLPKLVMQAAVLNRGTWTMTDLAKAVEPAVAASSPRITTGVDTRRVPRFRVQEAAEALAEGSSVRIVDLSTLGAQVISQPILRPNQKIKVGLRDESGVLQVTAHVAWSMFEKPAQATEPHFRVGMEFDDALREAVEDYCRRRQRLPSSA